MTIDPTTGLISWNPNAQDVNIGGGGTITFSEPGLVAGYGPDPFFPGTPKGTVLTTSTTPTNEFAAEGVLFSTPANEVTYVSTPAFVGGLAGPSGGNVLAINTVDNSVPGKLTAQFVNPVTGLPGTIDASSLSVFVSDYFDALTVRTFGADGQLLEEKDLTSLGETLHFSVGRIARVEFTDYLDGGFTIDDFLLGP